MPQPLAPRASSELGCGCSQSWLTGAGMAGVCLAAGKAQSSHSCHLQNWPQPLADGAAHYHRSRAAGRQQYRKQFCSVLTECLTGHTAMVKVGSLLCPKVQATATSILLPKALHCFLWPRGKKLCQHGFKMPFDQHGQRQQVQCTCPKEGFSTCHCSALQHTSKIGTWQTKPPECIAKQNALPSPHTRTACYRALANS